MSENSTFLRKKPYFSRGEKIQGKRKQSDFAAFRLSFPTQQTGGFYLFWLRRRNLCKITVHFEVFEHVIFFNRLDFGDQVRLKSAGGADVLHWGWGSPHWIKFQNRFKAWDQCLFRQTLSIGQATATGMEVTSTKEKIEIAED